MPDRWNIRRVEGADRHTVVAFMQAQFLRHFSAVIEDDSEQVFGIFDTQGQLCGAFGLSWNRADFFCRHYVSELEQALMANFDFSGAPDAVVELSHFCVEKPATVCRILPQLADFLRKRASVLVCTATSELARFFYRKGLASHRLGDATQAALPRQARSEWGSYYDHAPVVLAGSLLEAAQHLQLQTVPLHPEVLTPSSRVMEASYA